MTSRTIILILRARPQILYISSHFAHMPYAARPSPPSVSESTGSRSRAESGAIHRLHGGRKTITLRVQHALPRARRRDLTVRRALWRIQSRSGRSRVSQSTSISLCTVQYNVQVWSTATRARSRQLWRQQ